jgi:hypothetical protein
MAKSDRSTAVTTERASRLYRLVKLLGSGPQTREALTKRLRLNMRGFYRDLDLLRHYGLNLPLKDRRYTLEEDVDDALVRLPLPDPQLTLGEALALAKGRSRAHSKLKAQIAKIIR